MLYLSKTQENSEKAMSDFVRDFRMKKDSKESELVSQGRINLATTHMSFPASFHNWFQYKSRVYNLPGYNFIPINISFIEETVKQKIKVDLEIISLFDLYEKLDKLGNTKALDFYFGSIKENPKNLHVIFDYDKMILVTEKYPVSVQIIKRNRIKDYSNNNGNTINIPIDDKGLFNESFKLVFANGFKTNNYSIDVQSDDSINIVMGDKGITECEIVILPGYVRQILIQDTNWKDIYEGAKLTINMANVLIYVSGKLSSLYGGDYERKGNSLLRITSFNKFGRELVIMHDEEAYEAITTYNIYDWYKDNINHNVIAELNNNSSPDVIKNFRNFKEDISTSISYDCNKECYDLNKSLIDKLIIYNSENFKSYIDMYLEKRHNFSYNMYMNANAYDYRKYIRYDNHDVPSKRKHELFPFPMVMVKIDNPKYKPIKVYIDGIALFRHIKTYNAMGETYIYIRLNKFMKNSVVEIERYDSDNDRYDEEVMIDKTGIFKLDKKYPKELINVYHVSGLDYTPVDFESNDDSITLIDKTPGLYRIVINNAVIYNEYVVNSRKLEKVEFVMYKHKFSLYDAEHYRVYKNGRLIPRKFYEITFPNKDNKLEAPSIKVQCQCFMSEVITVEYVPYKMKEVYSQDLIDEFGRVKIDKNTLEYPVGLSIDSMYLNGRKLNNENIIQKSSTGLELINIISRKNFYILLKEDYDSYTNFPEFTQQFKTGNSAFDDYIKDVMVGSRINDLETDELDKDYNVMRDLYWDLYNEYLKYAIVNFGDKLPKYIAIKYSDLVDEENMVLIDCSEEMNHWMPLDASQTIDEKMEQILATYEKMVDKITNMETLEPYELSLYEIEKLKQAGLVTDNVIAIDLSE